MQAARPPRIAILGGGFAGIAVAQRLESLLRQDRAEIVLISRENFSLFTPMLPEVSSGGLDVNNVATPIRSQLHKTQFILADVTNIDVAKNDVTFVHTLTGETETLEYDQLVIAVGSTISTFNLPGVAERVFALKTLEDAGILRNRIVYLLELADSLTDPVERAKLLTVVVVGGGFTGVEAAGEFVELFHSVVRYYPTIKLSEIRLVLIEGGPVLLPGLPEKMGTYSLKNLRKLKVEVITGDAVAGADDCGIILQSGKRIDTATIVWSAGVKPSPLVAKTNLPLTRHGALIVGQDFRVQGTQNVWALGDCAAIPDGEGGTYPQTAQHAIREGPVLAQNIAAVLRGRPTKPFRFRSLGMMASLGARKAVAQLPGDRVLTGFPAWFLWRLYYLLRLPGLDRRLRVAFDWTLDMLFPRDIAELRVYTRHARSSAATDTGITQRDEPAVRL